MVETAFIPKNRLSNDYDIKKMVCGLKQLGVDTQEVNSVEEIPKDQKNYMVVGDVLTIREWRAFHKIKDSFVGDFPEELIDYYKRSLSEVTIQEAFDFKGGHQFFKPLEKGLFTPFVAQRPFNADIYYSLMHLHGDIIISAQGVIHPVVEWRVFILNRHIADVRRYNGTWESEPDIEFIKRVAAIDIGHHSYCIDVARLDSGEMCVIEVNRAESFGSYGLNPLSYAEMNCAWWNEVWEKQVYWRSPW